MIHLPDTLKAWKTAGFDSTLKQEVRQLDPDELPLQQCLAQGSYASGDDLELMIISSNDTTREIHVKTGVFFHSRIPGCACADDPTPESAYAEYCVWHWIIDKHTAETHITWERDA